MDMSVSRQSDDSAPPPEGFDFPIDWELAEDERQLEAAIDYMLSMTAAERLRRNEAAVKVIRRLDAIAAKHGLRAMGWTTFGPARDRDR